MKNKLLKIYKIQIFENHNFLNTKDIDGKFGINNFLITKMKIT